MKLLALRCPKCDYGLVPAAPDIVTVCPNCRSAVRLEEGDLSLVEPHYAAPLQKSTVEWVPFWGFEGHVHIISRESQNRQVSLDARRSAQGSQDFWARASRFFIPAWDLEITQASQLARELLEAQPGFRRIDRPASGSFQPVVTTPEDARKLLELVVVTVEARRRDWMRYLDFTMEMGEPALWILPAEREDERWHLLAEQTRS